jgi:hypothetical protein
MAQIETYRAVADAEVALAVAGVTSPFTIEVRFMGGLSPSQQDAFRGAADRWIRLIVGDLPSLIVDGEVIDDVLILAQGEALDGPGGVLGQAGSTALRPASANFLPAKGIMSFDQADLEQMEAAGTLDDVITHEMGHVLGIGRRLWQLRGFLSGAGTSNPIFTGPGAMEEYARLRGGDPQPVPVANVGGLGTRDTHWREAVFANELMTGSIGNAGNPISRMTVASLGDLGYTVDIDAAEPYELPNHLSLAEEGLVIPHTAPINVGIMLPTVPLVMPEENLQ